MQIQIRNQCSDFNSYRAARVKSLFNCETGADFRLDADLPIEQTDWKIGVVVGPSGSGKTSIGRTIWPDVGIYDGDQGWPQDKPIVEAIAPEGNFDDVTGALSAVGLGSVPAWLRPYHALSNGEKFRAGMARVIAEGRGRVIIDEFTSVVDRQIARIGAAAFSKAWKRGGVRRCCCPATTTSWTGSNPTGCSTPARASFNGGYFGAGQKLSSKFSRRTARTGQCLSRITI